MTLYIAERFQIYHHQGNGIVEDRGALEKYFWDFITERQSRIVWKYIQTTGEAWEALTSLFGGMSTHNLKWSSIQVLLQ